MSIVDIRLTAVEGVIETRDLEVVAALDAMDNLRRLDPSERIDRSLARRLRKQREREERSRRVRARDFYQRRAGRDLEKLAKGEKPTN